jgi:YVTN family beta-propeller protein
VANPIIGQGGQPQAPHFAFVVNYNPANNSTTMRVDVPGDTNLETQFVGAGALGESFLAGNTGALFTANSIADSISEFNTITTNNQVLTLNLPIGSKPIAVATAKAGFVFSLNSGNNATCPSTGSVSVADTTALGVISTICVGVNPASFAQLPDGTKIYVANKGDNTVSVIDPDLQMVVATLTQAMGIGLKPTFVLPSSDGSYIFVINQGDGTSPGSLTLIANFNNQVVATIPLGVSPSFAFLDTHLNRLYVTNTGSNSVTVFDVSHIVASNNPPMPTLATTNVGSGPVGVTALPDGSRFYTANSQSNDVTVASASSFGVLKTIPVGQNPVWIASEPSSTKVYTANFNSGSVSIIKTVNDSVVNTMNAPQQDPNCSSNCALQQPSMILTF